MRVFNLRRYGSIPGIGTFGILDIGLLELATVEQEWLDNRPGISCIPCGRYRLVPYNSPTYPNHYGLVNEDRGVYLNQSDVPDSGGRWGILIHVANLASQLQGCIAPGLNHAVVMVNGMQNLGVTNSGRAYNAFAARMSLLDEEVYLDIEEVMREW